MSCGAYRSDRNASGAFDKCAVIDVRAQAMKEEVLPEANAVRVPPVRWVRVMPALSVITPLCDPLKNHGSVLRERRGLWSWCVGVCGPGEELRLRKGTARTEAEGRRLVESGWHELFPKAFERLRISALANGG